MTSQTRIRQQFSIGAPMTVRISRFSHFRLRQAVSYLISKYVPSVAPPTVSFWVSQERKVRKEKTGFSTFKNLQVKLRVLDAYRSESERLKLQWGGVLDRINISELSTREQNVTPQLHRNVVVVVVVVFLPWGTRTQSTLAISMNYAHSRVF